MSRPGHGVGVQDGVIKAVGKPFRECQPPPRVKLQPNVDSEGMRRELKALASRLYCGQELGGTQRVGKKKDIFKITGSHQLSHTCQGTRKAPQLQYQGEFQHAVTVLRHADGTTLNNCLLH